MILKAPFPWMGGKSAIADLVWARIGDVQNAIDPFCGSCSWLLRRPAWHTGRIETVNDINHYVVNFFRAVVEDPAGVARFLYGQWHRTCFSETTTTRLGLTGIMLDPPYPTHKADGKRSRDGHLYQGDDRSSTDDIRDKVLAYCLKHGGHPLMRIAVCGYDTDGYSELEQHGWDCVAWRAQGGYANRAVRAGRENKNRNRERIWFSPQCLRPNADLFANLKA